MWLAGLHYASPAFGIKAKPLWTPRIARPNYASPAFGIKAKPPDGADGWCANYASPAFGIKAKPVVGTAGAGAIRTCWPCQHPRPRRLPHKGRSTAGPCPDTGEPARADPDASGTRCPPFHDARPVIFTGGGRNPTATSMLSFQAPKR